MLGKQVQLGSGAEVLSPPPPSPPEVRGQPRMLLVLGAPREGPPLLL